MLICHAAGVARNGQRLCSKLLSSKGGRRVLRRIFNPQSDGEQFLLGGLPLAFLITPLEWKHQSSDGNCDANLWEKPFPLNSPPLLSLSSLEFALRLFFRLLFLLSPHSSRRRPILHIRWGRLDSVKGFLSLFYWSLRVWRPFLLQEGSMYIYIYEISNPGSR